MVIGVDLATPVFAAAETVTVPLPLPLAPAVIVSHDVPPVAVHAQPLPAATLILAAPPAAGSERLGGVGTIEQPLLWVTMNDLSPIVSIPVRDPPVVAAAVYCTVPFPLPLAPEEMVSHGMLLVAVQAHPAALVTATLPLLPSAGTLAEGAASTTEQPLPCVSVKVCPAMVIVPGRAPPEVDAAVYCTVPLPVPLAPDVMVIHEALLVAVHAQPLPPVTATLPDPPDAPTLALPGAIENEQPLSWLTMKALPPIVSVPDRGPPSVAAAVNCTVPLPLPLLPAVIVNHDAPLLAVQPQSAPAVTFTLPEPPAASTLVLVAASAITQPLPCDTVITAPATLIVPLRAAPVRGATVKAMLPPPLPDAGPVSVIQGALLEAVQVQPPPASIVAEPVPPLGENGCTRGATAKSQPPVCDTVTACPATSTVPVRGGPDVASTTSRAAPGPAPVAPWATVTHGTLLTAVHGHAAAVATETVVAPPEGPGAKLFGEMAKVQPSDCVIAKRSPAATIVPVRGGPVPGATS